jgi:hypothetical protein
MMNIEKKVFISYRRKDISWALLVYKYLSEKGFDVFFDFESIPSGDFEQTIIGNIRARAHFVVILTPTALDRCNKPGDWLRREIEMAISEKRNIVPLFFNGFSFGTSSVSKKLKGGLVTLPKYNGLSVPADYFEPAMEKLRTQFLNVALDAVLHPISDEVQKIVDAQKMAANHAIAQLDDVQGSPKIAKRSVDPYAVLSYLIVAPGMVAGVVGLIIAGMIVWSNYGIVTAQGFGDLVGWWFFFLPLLLGLLPIGGPIIYSKNWPDLILSKLQNWQLDPKAAWNISSWLPWLSHQFVLDKTLYWTGYVMVWSSNIILGISLVVVLVRLLVERKKN